MLLDELDIPVTGLKGVGKETAVKLARLGIATVADLLSYFPRAYDDRRFDLSLAESAKGARANTVVTVIGHDWFMAAGKMTLKILVEDTEGTEATLVCFNRPFLERSLPVESVFRVRGFFETRFGALQCASFETDKPDAKGRIVPVYPLTSGISSRAMETLVAQAISRYCRELEPDVPASILRSRSLMGPVEAIRAMHAPNTQEDADLARRSLAFCELMRLQTFAALRAVTRRGVRIPRTLHKDALAASLRQRLPFALTEGQEKAIGEIRASMRMSHPMARLLMGDVGSGKTLVALFAALDAIESGMQVAFMAPTELLARQHADNAAALLEPLGVKLAYLGGTIAAEPRRRLLEALARGEIRLLVGTHALFSSEVRFRSLGLVVIDEQHRFGVMQRLALGEKGEHPDLLMMTATPIPRTLANVAFGDLDTSVIGDLPAGRQVVTTHLTKMGNEERVYEFVRERLDEGRQAYFVYPAIDSTSGLKSVDTMYAKLSKEVFPDRRIGLLHSKLKEEERRATMAAFASGALDVLVATSVVEVGVDVSNASCMVIEHAERFGLAALHQLRGRVGRGRDKSFCFLVYDPELEEGAKERLRMLLETGDGFKIAEADHRLRGPGDITGTSQAGVPAFRCADLSRDADLCELARADALALVERDPSLSDPENAALAKIVARASKSGL